MTWYRPLEKTVSCLSKLYRCLEPSVFTGLAQVLNLSKLRPFISLNPPFTGRFLFISLDNTSYSDWHQEAVEVCSTSLQVAMQFRTPTPSFIVFHGIKIKHYSCFYAMIYYITVYYSDKHSFDVVNRVQARSSQRKQPLWMASFF